MFTLSSVSFSDTTLLALDIVLSRTSSNGSSSRQLGMSRAEGKHHFSINFLYALKYVVKVLFFQGTFLWRDDDTVLLISWNLR